MKPRRFALDPQLEEDGAGSSRGHSSRFCLRFWALMASSVPPWDREPRMAPVLHFAMELTP